MINETIIEYHSNIDYNFAKKIINLHNDIIINENLIKNILLSFEQYLCFFYKKIFSKALIKITLDLNINKNNIENHMQNLINKKIIFGPLLKIVDIKNDDKYLYITYEAGVEKSIDPIILFLIICFFNEYIKNQDQIFDEIFSKYIKKTKIIYNTDYINNINIIKINSILKETEIKLIFSDNVFNEYKEEIMFFVDISELIFQKFILNQYFGENILNFIIPDDISDVNNIEKYIKNMILLNKLPGKFIKINSIFNKNNQLIVEYTFGGCQVSEYNLFFIKNMVKKLFYSNNLSFFQFVNSYKKGDFYEV